MFDHFKLLEWYHNQGRSAARRRIEYLITFEQWLDVWIKSGKLHLRGAGKGHYVMARNGDVGPYSIENVNIVPFEQNARDVWKNKGALIRRKMSEAQKGRVPWNLGIPNTKEHNENISNGNKGKKCPYNIAQAAQMGFANLGKKHSVKSRYNMGKSHVGNKHSDATKLKMKLARIVYWDKQRTMDR